MIFNFMSTYFISRLTGGLFEGEGIISCLYDGVQGVGEAGGISGEDLDLSLWWINLAENSLFMEEWNW